MHKATAFEKILMSFRHYDGSIKTLSQQIEKPICTIGFIKLYLDCGFMEVIKQERKMLGKENGVKETKI